MTKIDHTERNRAIVAQYLTGMAISKIAVIYHVTRSRIHQIVQESGVIRVERVAGMKYAFIGINVTEDAKAAFHRHAATVGKSMSQLAAELIDAEIKRIEP